ncbi:MAG: pilus assembly protein [Spirochaetales bacterium]|nr:pilus assembly protein [Spirochaetales bacterium]
MKSVLVGPRPLVALFDGSDSRHAQAVDFLKTSGCRLVSTWPVVTDACNQLSFSHEAVHDFLSWCERGGVRILDLGAREIERIIELGRSEPFDLSMASLAAISETVGVKELWVLGKESNQAMELDFDGALSPYQA